MQCDSCEERGLSAQCSRCEVRSGGGGGGGGGRGKPGRGFQLQVSRGERETVMQDEKLALECAAKAYLQRLS